MAKIFSFLTLLSIITSLSVISSAIDEPLSFSTSTSSTTTTNTLTTTPSPSSSPYSSSSEIKTSPSQLSPLTSVSRILSELGYHDLAMASRSLSFSSEASNLPWLHRPVTVFAPADSSVRTCPSCSVPILLQEHSVPGLYSFEYLTNLIFGTRIETILPGRRLTVTSAVNSTRIFIGGAEVTRPDLYVSESFIIHGVQGFISHLSPYSCSVDKLTSLNLPHPSTTAALTRMMIADAMIRLRTSGYNFLSLAMRVKYAELVTLNNMTIFAVDDSTIFHGGQSYVHSVRYHIIPNQILKYSDLESFPVSTVLPTLERGEFLTVTTPGGGGAENPMRINYVKIRNPNFIANAKIIIHGVFSPFPHLHQSVRLPAGRSGFYTVNSGEFGSDVRETTENTVRQSNNASPPPAVVKSTVQIDDDIHQGL